MKKTLLLLSTLLTGTAWAQPITELQNIRIYEHHSSSINNGMTFGNFANGTWSGYNFQSNLHYPSFDPATWGPWGPSQVANIDLVEHNGPFGNGQNFGFTSGVSTIWFGDIQGNGLTKYMVAPAGFNYDTVTNVATIKNAYVSTQASTSVTAVDSGRVYLAQIRNTNRYVAMKITKVVNEPPGAGPNDTLSVYFDFKYKYGDFVATAPCVAPSGIMTSSITASSVTLAWTAITGSTGYEYAVTTSATPPASGATVTGLTVTKTGLTSGTAYYAHVRTKCGTSYSPWTSQSFNTTTTSIDHLSSRNSGASIFPNPARNTITFKRKSNHVGKLMITETTGRILTELIIRGEETTVDIQSLPSGIYYLQYANGFSIETLKFSKL